MFKANFILPFDIDTRKTDCPASNWVHLGRESEKGTVLVQVRDNKIIIETMKTNPKYVWLEDIEENIVDGELRENTIMDCVTTRESVEKHFDNYEMDNLIWDSPQDVINNVVQLHGLSLRAYQEGGLG